MENMQIYLVYITTGDKDEARSIGRMLVASNLAACVNILENMTAIYKWEGELKEDGEVVLIAKTTRDRFAELKEKVTEHHSYDCPCIVAFRVSDGHGPFLDWIVESVGRDAVC